MSKVNLNILVTVSALMIIITGPAAAVTHYVSPGESIQAAINDSNDGDEIEVAPGTYYETINFIYKSVRLYSNSGPNVTTIDANGTFCVIRYYDCEQADTILEGFTITGGYYPQGGGMYCENSNPTITNCVFIDNTAYHSGGGIHNNNSNPMVINCTFSGNTADYGIGGGMFNNNSSPTVDGCTFRGNTSGYLGGGGMCNIVNSNPTVTNCVFIDNTADDDGGGMHNYHSDPTVTNCVFSGNTADLHGGGMYNDHSDPTVTNCTFSRNSAISAGSGLYNHYGSLTITNCILWGNEPNEIDAYPSSGIFTVTYSDIQGGFDGLGNIDADPCFIDAAAGNFRLKPDSPCIDAANSIVLLTLPVLFDLDGNYRCYDVLVITDTASGPFEFLDIGAYEFQCSGITGDNNCDGVVGYKDLEILCNNWLEGLI